MHSHRRARCCVQGVDDSVSPPEACHPVVIDTFRFEVPASSANLGPGYQVLGVALDITLKVRVDVRRKGEGISIERRAGVVEQFDDPRHDPILRAIHAAATRFAIRLPAALHVTIESDIPPACGLGTTSASYACGLAVAARLAKESPARGDLVAELVELGGDPAHGAAAMVGGLVACCQLATNGTTLRSRVFSHALQDDWRFVGVAPAGPLGIAALARLRPASLPHACTARTTGRARGGLRALALGDEELLTECIVDDVHVPYRRHALPGMTVAMRAAVEAGAAGATISGAGPALIAFTTQAARVNAIGSAMADAFTAESIPSRTLVSAARMRGALDWE
jgi:homoserine kinase